MSMTSYNKNWLLVLNGYKTWVQEVKLEYWNCTKHCHTSKKFSRRSSIVLSDTTENACQASKDIDNDANADMRVSTMIRLSTNHNNNTTTKMTNIVLTSLTGTAPTSITVGCDMMFLAFLWGNSIGITLDIWSIELVNIHVYGFLDAGREGDTKIMGEEDVVQDIQCRFHMAGCRMNEVWWEEEVDSGQI